MRAISSMATRHVLADIGAAWSAAGQEAIEIESVGGVDAANRVAAGEPFELVFLAEGALKRLAASGHVDGQTLTPLLISQVAVAVPEAGAEVAERPAGSAFADAEGMREAILAADRVGYSTGPSGAVLLEQLDAWGIRDELAERLVQARPGIPVARLLAEGEVSLGFQQLSELVGEPGVRILGVLPVDCAIDTIFAGAVATTAADPAAAAAALHFFAGDAAMPIKLTHNFTPVGGS